MSEKRKPLSFSLCRANHDYIDEQVEERKKTNSRYTRSMYADDLFTHLRVKAEAKPKTELVVKQPKTKLAVVEVDGLNKEAWDKWIAYRKTTKLKAYKTNAKKKELATLGNYDEQMQIVMTSINNEYAGLFPLKTNNSAVKAEEHDDALNDISWANNLDDVL